MLRSLVLVTTAAAIALPLTGCRLNYDERVTGTAIGVGAGALAGGLLGTAIGSTATGAILGAVAGGAAGYIIGDWMADRRERQAAQANARDEEYRRADAAPAEATAPRPAPVPFDAVPASASGGAPARAEMARREYEAGRAASDPGVAIRHYDASARFDPSRPEPHNARGLVLLYQGKKLEARAAFQRALSVDPAYAPASENLRRISMVR